MSGGHSFSAMRYFALYPPTILGTNQMEHPPWQINVRSLVIWACKFDWTTV